MLRDLCQDVFWVCVAITSVVVALVAVKSGSLYLFTKSRRVPSHGPNFDALFRNHVEESPPELKSEPKPQRLEPVTTAEKFDTVVEQPELEPILEPIECGHCGKEITSGYTEVKKNGSDGDLLVFECEHCGKRVAIPG